MTFISKVKQGAINGWHTHQILPSISIAQAILESASGTSTLGAKYNNLFGIKASEDWTGKVINLPTREYGANGSYQTNANFRWYDSWSDSMLDHAAFFTNTPWREINYAAVVGEKDYKKAAQALQSAGYATDPQYATKLIQRIEQNNLTQYDTEAFNGAPSNVGVIKKVVGGTLTELAKSAVKQYNVTLIGDSLGVGTQPKLTGVFKSFTHDVLGSRQITHATNSLNGTYVLQSLKDYGQLKDIVVVILGTNRGVTDTEIDNFVAIAGSSRKVIFVDTNSQVGHRQSVSDAYRRASERHNNVYHANWMAYSNSLRSRYYGSDNIHMTNEGYQAHADFIKMAVYEAGIGVKTTLGTIGTLTEYIGIEELDYKEGDLISPKGESVIYNHPANELWGSKTGERVIWIESILEVDSDDPQFILETAVKVMKENGQPAAQYVVDLAELPDDVSIGDWGYVLDHEFNPPLYIHARVLEIITSETDLNANKAVIGNVTEVFPADKTDIKLIQADLKDARDNLVRDYRKGQPILMLVDSTNGSTLGDKYIETELVAKVTQGSEDLTNQFITYTWERVSNDTASDDIYNEIISTETTNRLIITSKDIVNNLSTFVVRVYDSDNLINQSSITIKHVDTALWTDTNTPPSDAKDGATWVDETGKHWILKDGEWEERVDQAVVSQVRVEVEGAMAEAEQAKQDAVKAYEDAVAEAKRLADEADALIRTKIEEEVGAVETELSTAKQNAIDATNQALADAKAHAIAQDTALKTSIQGDIDTVETELSTAKQNAIDATNRALADAKAHAIAQDTALKSTLQGEIGGAMAEAEQAKADAIKAYDDSIAEAARLVAAQDEVWQGKMNDYDEQVALIDASASDAQIKADQALQDVGISTDLAQSAKDLADTAKTNAQAALDNANSAVGDASKALTAAQDAESKAGTAISDASAALTASQNAESKAGTAISDAGQALSKAQALDGEFNDLSLVVDDLNKEVALRLTSAEVSSLVDGKGLAEVTYVDNKIQATSESIGAELTKVEGKIPQSYTEENLVLNSKVYVSNSDYLIKRYDLAKQLTVGKEYTIVLDGGIGSTGSDQQFGIYFDNGGSFQESLVNIAGGIYKKTFTLVQSGPNSGDKSSFSLYNLPQRGAPAVINWIKLVEGKAKDNTYRPSMNELLMENDFKVFKGEYVATAEALTSRLTAIDKVGGRLSTAETNISQNATDISARLTTAQVNSLVDGKGLATATYVNNQISATATGIRTDLTKVEGKIDGLKVGVRNLLRNSNFTDDFTYWTGVGTRELIPDAVFGNVAKFTTTSNTGIIQAPTKALIVGKEYTLSTYVKAENTSQTVYLAIDGNGVGAAKAHTISNQWTKISSVFTFSGVNLNARIYTVGVLYVANVKLEEGNTVTDWTPAPEDTMMENDFKVFKGEYEATAEDLSSRLTAIDKVGGRLSTAETLISQNATDISARLTTAQVNSLVDGKGLVNATYVNNQITTTANGITAEITRVEGKIPQSYTEENLVLNSKVYVNNQDYMIREYTLSKQLVVGKEYTIVLSGGIGSNGTNQLFGIYFDNAQSGQGTLQYTGGGIYKKTFTLLQTGTSSGDKSKFRLYNIPNPNTNPHSTINWIKLVEGKVTDNIHTPSMSDLLLQNDFTVFKKTTDDSIKAINTELSKTAKTTDLNGMVTETVLSTKNYVTAGSMSTTLENYAQKNNVPTNTQFNTLKNSYDSMVQTIGTNGSRIAQMVMTDSLFKTEVIKNVPSAIGGRNYVLKSNVYYYTTNYKVTEYDLSTIPKGTKIKISLWGGLGTSARTFGVYVNNSSGIPSGNSQIIELTKLDGVFGQGVASPLAKWTGEATLNVDATKILIFGLDNNTTSPKRIEYVQIETGDYFTDWTAAPEDKADQSQVTQLADSWILTLKSGGDIKSQINATTDSIRLASKLIHLSGTSLIDTAVIKSAHIDTLNANKIVGNTADFNTIRTGVLTTDAVTATHIKSENALIDNIFATQALVDRLWAKAIWTNKITTMSLNASQIKAGTIETARLNASDIVTNGLTANVIKSTHIQANYLLVDKVFADQASIDRLWAKAIWTNKLTALEIDAGQIKTGTIDTAILDATDIVTSGLTADVIDSTYIKADELLVEKVFATQASVDRLWAKEIWSNKITTVKLDASQIDAGTINAARLNVKEIVTNGLSTDVVTSTHIKAENALIDTIFGTQALIDRLWSKEFWANKITAIKLDASQINAGTISADRISTSSLANIELGGRNYAQGTTSKMQYNQNIATYSGLITPSNASKSTYTLSELNAKAGDTYTASIYIGAGGGYGSGLRIDNQTGATLYTSPAVSNGYTSVTFTVKPTDTEFRFYYANYSGHTVAYKIEACKFQIEKGNKRTDWTQNPADFGIAGKVEIHGGNIKADTLDVGAITGDTAKLLTLSFESLNSNMKLHSGAIQIQNNDGDFATMNTIPEFRSQDSAGTAAIMGKGRSHYYSGNQSRFYIGSNLEGLAQYGIHIGKGQTFGIYRNSDTYGGTPAQYHTVVKGEYWRSITTKYWNDSTSVDVLMRLNGYNVNNYPVLQPGDVLLIKPAVPGNESGVETLWSMGTSSAGETRLYSHPEHVFNYRIEVQGRARFIARALFEDNFVNNSDRRIKHDIKNTEVTALDHLDSLTFKEYKLNSTGKKVLLGLVAQDSGILRVKGEDEGDYEGIDGMMMPMLAMKGVQELHAIVKEQAEEIRQLKEKINK